MQLLLMSSMQREFVLAAMAEPYSNDWALQMVSHDDLQLQRAMKLICEKLAICHSFGLYLEVAKLSEKGKKIVFFIFLFYLN